MCIRDRRMATHNRLKAVWITAMPGRVEMCIRDREYSDRMLRPSSFMMLPLVRRMIIPSVKPSGSFLARFMISLKCRSSPCEGR